MNVYGGNYTDGDKFESLTRKVGFDRMIPPHALEVCYNKTTHIIFPAEITYVDLGNENLVAGLADGAKNVLRVKSAFKSFKQETNLPANTPTASAASLDVPRSAVISHRKTPPAETQSSTRETATRLDRPNIHRIGINAKAIEVKMKA